MRELVYYIATSLDGYIARTDGSFSDFPWDEAFIDALRESFPETLPAPMRPGASRDENRRFDAVLMGRRTYEVGSAQGLMSPYPTLDQYVVSSSMSVDPDPDVSLVRSNPVAFVTELKRSAGKAIWICGGSELATPLLEAGLIDRVILKVAPVLFGDGIPLFRSEIAIGALDLQSRREFESGYTISEFRVPTRPPE